MEPLDRATIWPYRDGEPAELYYQRYAHPNGVAAERALGELEGGEALLFPSGTGAATALVLAFLEPGQMIALAEGGYYGTGVLFDALERWGVRHVEFDQTGPPPDGADLVWLEAPSNPFLTMPDIEAAVASPARVVVDSTASTPVYLRPLEHGADFALHSATKFLGGHHDVLLGAVSCRSARGRRAPARLPQPHRHRRGARPVLAALPLAEDAQRADGAAHGERDRDRRAPARAPCGRARALPGLRRPPLVRRRRRRGGRARSRPRCGRSRTPRAWAASSR